MLICIDRTTRFKVNQRFGYFKSLLSVLIILHLEICGAEDTNSLPTSPSTENSSSLDSDKPNWQSVRKNLYFGKVFLRSDNPLFKSELFLVKFNPKDFELLVAVSKELTKLPTSDIRSLVKKANGVAGINASFFDVNRKPLGLIISSPNVTYGSLQMGGKLLTGVFQVINDIPSIVHRSDFKIENQRIAIQAGPRIIANKNLLPFSDDEPYSRRSGLAINSAGEIILFATAVRFPGARMTDIQIALMNLGFPIVDALNFDGGGSSQLFVESYQSENDIFVSGGDDIPVALVLKEKLSK